MSSAPKGQIPDKWQTTRLDIQDSRFEEELKLQAVYDSCAYIGVWCGGDHEPDAMHKSLLGEYLPPNGLKELQRLQSITLREDEDRKLVGYLELYHGFPDASTLWIASFAISAPFQNRGFGREAVEGFIECAKVLGAFEFIGAGVGAKNWPALQFWIGLGFDQIINFKGDRECTERTFADFWLVRKVH